MWAVGTDYVWVDGEEAEEFYLIELSPDGDVSKAKVKRSFAGIGVRNLLYVENYLTSTTAQAMQEDIMERIRVSETNRPSDETVDAVGTSGLVVGILALVVGLGNMAMMTVFRSRRAQSGGQERVSGTRDENDGEGSWTKEQPSLPSQV